MGLSTKIAVAALCVALLAMFAGFMSTQTAAQRNCRKIEHLKSYAYKTTQRAQHTLRTQAYYKAHPAELKIALAQNAKAAKFFAPQDCPFTIFG